MLAIELADSKAVWYDVGVEAGSSIRQSSGLQNRRLQVRFLSRLPHPQRRGGGVRLNAIVLKTIGP
jgi:hypothetical protein